MTADVGTALKSAVRRLRDADIDTARLDARLLLGDVLAVEPPDLIAHPERELTAGESDRFLALIDRRCAREPVSQLLGRREFWGLSLRVTADTLSPRPETETLVEAALTDIADRTTALRLLDLGTGTGCLLLALLHSLPRATGVGVDHSEPAVAVARANAAELGLAARAVFRRGDWTEGLDERFDLVVSNPPYIATAEIEWLMPEVSSHEPHLALDGGQDGLTAYRAIAHGVRGCLRPGGRLVLEIGAGQGDSVEGVFVGAGFQVVTVRNDLLGLPRALVLQWNP